MTELEIVTKALEILEFKYKIVKENENTLVFWNNGGDIQVESFDEDKKRFCGGDAVGLTEGDFERLD